METKQFLIGSSGLYIGDQHFIRCRCSENRGSRKQGPGAPAPDKMPHPKRVTFLSGAGAQKNRRSRKQGLEQLHQIKSITGFNIHILYTIQLRIGDCTVVVKCVSRNLDSAPDPDSVRWPYLLLPAGPLQQHRQPLLWQLEVHRHVARAIRC